MCGSWSFAGWRPSQGHCLIILGCCRAGSCIATKHHSCWCNLGASTLCQCRVQVFLSLCQPVHLTLTLLAAECCWQVLCYKLLQVFILLHVEGQGQPWAHPGCVPLK